MYDGKVWCEFQVMKGVMGLRENYVYPVWKRYLDYVLTIWPYSK